MLGFFHWTKKRSTILDKKMQTLNNLLIWHDKPTFPPKNYHFISSILHCINYGCQQILMLNQNHNLTLVSNTSKKVAKNMQKSSGRWMKENDCFFHELSSTYLTALWSYWLTSGFKKNRKTPFYKCTLGIADGIFWHICSWTICMPFFSHLAVRSL